MTLFLKEFYPLHKCGYEGIFWHFSLETRRNSIKAKKLGNIHVFFPISTIL